MEDEALATVKMEEANIDVGVAPHSVKMERDASRTSSQNMSNQGSRTTSMSPAEDTINGEDTSTPGGTQRPKLSRKASQKPVKRESPLFHDLPNVTEQSCNTFQVIPDCLYGSKHMGSTDNDALDCDCRSEWQDGKNLSCGEDSDCINRATKMECVAGAGNCGDGCQNQRFQRKEYANVSVIKTEKKGFGLRADVDLQANDFIFEYIGEVINEPTFRRRMVQYDDEGIKHFYFMSLTKHEFVDATKKGNLGRFCNHSCNPNCYVDKWVVGEKLRMGIFSSRRIKAGEELVFNYNVDRYGADPQPCYCGEPNCTGFIGGKTQTERATKLPLTTVEALGIDDGDSWDIAVAKKPRKKKPEEDDEEYVNSVQAKSLDDDGARKVMATLMQCKEKWIAVKLLERIQQCRDERVIHSVMRMHAYQILKTTLNTFIDDHNVVLQVLDILDRFPRLTRNKIEGSKIETTIDGLTHSEHEEVSAKSKRLLDEWSKLELGYRIGKRKFDPNASATNSFQERRNMDREEDVTAKSTPDPLQNIEIPKGPRSNIPQRNTPFFNGPPRQRRHQNFNNNNNNTNNGALPAGWFTATDQRGNTYFYSKNGATTWQRPTKPADAHKSTPKALQEQQLLKNIIDQVTKEQTPKPSASQTPQRAETPVQETKQEKWRFLSTDKQMKIYENTLFPHVKYVIDKYRHKLPKDDLKRLGKDVCKKLVSSDYKGKRVQDPTTPLDQKQARKVKTYVKDFLDKAIVKFKQFEQEKEKASPAGGADKPTDGATTRNGLSVDTADVADEVMLSDMEDAGLMGSPDRKRKRGGEEAAESLDPTPSDEPSVKRLREDDVEDGPTPPPPPPPPLGDLESTATPEEPMTEEQKALREQEEALMRENEESERLEEEAELTKTKDVESAPQENNDATLNGHSQFNERMVTAGARGAADESTFPNASNKTTQQQEVLGH
ncbi:Histone-lysine N-methyltransferase, H3 lysine-36 specific [Colletotrichum tanaceti]|uniref:Histone-lysine N-methyltransferase, H3 lysine-36 specific n=1 Tax=Colletotrichum tanaceti TaxID=1306861 RepID=A0A4U6XC00_9PEZI|nr:Histone-lysine N-methyltransferase, H3 lysine-36 specific [Colletotrichum tanaceti]TKW53105.1 Histone-lysine N-methyltransferase, H3 lysine-36 specific [Colletotrichum tanaceti]